MSARDDLRRLLEQRLEAGETTIVLESMRAADVVAPQPGRPATAITRAGGIAPVAIPPRRAEPEVSERPAPDDRPSHMPDWRAALQESGAEPLAQKSNRAKQASAARVAASTPQLGKPTKVVVTPDGPLPPLESLTAVATAVAGCTRCPLYATATNPVPGEGNPAADFMVVGEAPGATEDETGKPFVGRAGQLLTQILAAIQLTREDVFICNVLKHRPPGNRNPEPDEVRACSPYLIRQIELIKPKVILALGTFSAQTLLETKIPIGKLRGQIHQYHGVPVVVTYHPAALLRNPAWKRPTWEDVQLARRILDSAVAGA